MSSKKMEPSMTQIKAGRVLFYKTLKNVFIKSKYVSNIITIFLVKIVNKLKYHIIVADFHGKLCARM